MDLVDSTAIERRVRLGYEWARLRRAILGFAPVLLVIAAAAMLGRPTRALIFGGALFGIGAALLWYGRESKRAVLPGVIAGLAPLAIALCAGHAHACSGDACFRVCATACAAGGFIAGAVVAVLGTRMARGPGFWVFASSLALLTGAMGCSDAGYAGSIGLAAGYVAGLAVGAARLSFR